MNIPEGWPTEEMVNAASDALINRCKMSEIITAALAAAPTPPAQEELRKAAEQALSLIGTLMKYQSVETKDITNTYANLSKSLGKEWPVK